MKRFACLIGVVAALVALSGARDARASDAAAPAAVPARPLRQMQEDFLSWRFGLFLHFNLGTVADRDWATGYEDPALFAPARLDCGQWADAARAAGMRYAVLTVKHTEGFALWDSAATTHDITAFKKFREGKGDLVREFVDAFRARGLKVGFYYCFPGDYSKGKLAPGQADLHGLGPEAAGDYAGFIKKQLRELLTNYGPIDLLWIDQYANPYTAAQWPEMLQFIRSLQPRCLVVANNSHDFKETDIFSYEFPWNNQLPPPGNNAPSEVCDTLQPGQRWFWDKNVTAAKLQTAEAVVARLRLCNSRHSNYLLNVPPDREGRISNPHLQRLQEIGDLLSRPAAPTKP